MSRIAVVVLAASAAFQLTANASEVFQLTSTLDFLPGGIPGITPRDFVIGLQGGISAVFLLRKPSPRAIVGSVIVGGFAGNYMGSMIALMATWPHDLSVYVSGVGGLTLCHGCVEFVTQWIKRVPK
jgi:hypothetical protein